MKNHLQAKKRQLAIARIIVRQLKKKPPTQPPKNESHADGIIQTNSSTNTLLSSQKSDAQQLRPVKGFVESVGWPPRGRKPDLAVLPPAAPWRQVRTVWGRPRRRKSGSREPGHRTETAGQRPVGPSSTRRSGVSDGVPQPASTMASASSAVSSARRRSTPREPSSARAYSAGRPTS